MKKRLADVFLLFSLAAPLALLAAPSAAADIPKIIIDADYNTLSDDGQLGVMAAQLQAEGKVEVMGISVVSGNKWLKQGVAEALKSVERLGVEKKIGIYSGANYALSHDFATIKKELALKPSGDGYLGT
jgi:inosine-uridine nucleoside N-ribohydrolase